MIAFRLTSRQQEAMPILSSDSTHVMLYGGSRSGKTFLIVRAIVMRALKAAASRHAIFRLRFNAVKASVIMDTFPKVMQLCFPGVNFRLDKTSWFVEFENGSQIWFGGLDEKERTEKILGMEFVTLYFNESSQIPWTSILLARTRLAQRVTQLVQGRAERPLKPRAYYDENPPLKTHWSYRVFVEKRDPESKEPLRNPEDYACFQINPDSNRDNLSDGYVESMSGSTRLRRRFVDGEFTDANPNQLFPDDVVDAWRIIDGEELPDFQRVIIGVDPSGADDTENARNDAIGIVVVALGIDGKAYLLEDLTVKAGPGTWGKIVGQTFDRLRADLVVGETNFGGAMVKFVVQAARPNTPYKAVTASRGKVVRAEPISAVYEQGKVRHVGRFVELEEELAAFHTSGYLGEHSPNRVDALIWALTELFHGIVAPRQPVKVEVPAMVHYWR